jgi:hypothetical protein
MFHVRQLSVGDGGSQGTYLASRLYFRLHGQHGRIGLSTTANLQASSFRGFVQQLGFFVRTVTSIEVPSNLVPLKV